jgi:hypothetical protein
MKIKNIIQNDYNADSFLYVQQNEKFRINTLQITHEPTPQTPGIEFSKNEPFITYREEVNWAADPIPARWIELVDWY